jgi:cobalamin biosynthesis protein CobD/CbiB
MKSSYNIQNRPKQSSLKIKHVLLLLSSLFVYLEWGGEQSVFLFMAEAAILKNLLTAPSENSHPMIVLPFIGQVLLLVNILKKEMSDGMAQWGLGLLSVLILFVTFIGIWTANIKIILSVIPFLVTATLLLREIHTSKKT